MNMTQIKSQNLLNKSSMSFVKIDKIDDVDCFVFNTCHIREKATQKVLTSLF